MPARTAARERVELVRRLHLLRMAGTAALAIVSLAVYVFDNQGQVAAAAILAATLSVSGVLWTTRLTIAVFRAVLVLDTVGLALWAWLMGGHSVGLAAVFAWILLGAALALGPRAVLRYLVLSLLAIGALGAAHLFFESIAYDRERVLLLNFAFSSALLLPMAFLTKRVGEVQRDAELVERHARLRLAELSEMREEFLSRISFEMRTPLTSVKGFTSTLIDAWDTLPEAEKIRFLHIVNRQSDRLARLIQMMVDLAQLDSGTLQMVSEKVNVGDVIGQVRAHIMRMTDAEIYVDCPSGLWVLGDRQRLRDMVDDLVDNALSYGAPPVEVVGRRVGDRVEIEVRDAGPGVSEEKQALLFERRTGAVAQTSVGGLGLALPLARELAREMGGDVSFAAPERGAAFVIALPAAEAPSSRVDSTRAPIRFLADTPARPAD